MEDYIAVSLCTYMPPAPPLTPPPLCSSPVHLLVCEHSSEGSLKITSEREATGAYAIGPRHVCADVAFGKKKKKKASLRVKKRQGGVGVGGGSSQATKVRQRTVRQQSASCLPAAWCGEGDATCQRVRGLAEWLHITLSAPATSHLYCNANPRPVPDGAFPASWVHRNMIIYPKHF